MNFVKPVNCRRCSGSGHLPGFDHVQLGMCFGCDGRGQVEGDKATIAARKARAAARTELGRAAFDHSHAAHSGLSLLEAREPARLDKAIDSFTAGRTDVLDALVSYFEEAREA